jgi:hypothetical protein
MAILALRKFRLIRAAVDGSVAGPALRAIAAVVVAAA